MKRNPWLGLLCLITLLQSGLWSSERVQASSDKYYLTISQPNITIAITSEQLSTVPPGGKLIGSMLINVAVGVPGQGNNGNKYILSWQIEPASGSDLHIPGGNVLCKIGNSTHAIEGEGDQNLTGQLQWEIPDSTPPGEYRYRITFVLGMGAQGQGVKCTETMEVVIKIPGCMRLWVEPESVELTYIGPDNIGSKEDLVRIYISCNTSWSLKYRRTNSSKSRSLEAVIEGVSDGVSGRMNSWTAIPDTQVELAVGPATNKSWVLLRLRAEPKCGLKTGSYPFELGFELEPDSRGVSLRS